MPLPPTLITRLESLLARLEPLLPAPPQNDWQALAYRWRHQPLTRQLHPLAGVNVPVRLQDLLCIDEPKALLTQNTRQFLAGLPANHALLWGPRGVGKSSLIKALLTEFSGQSLRLIEVEREHLQDLPEILAAVNGRHERFIIFCDDLSFEAGDASYKALKVVLDGSLSAPADNVLIYATSNRRHLLPESLADNQHVELRDGEIHAQEAVEEKLSLSERFGLWISLHPFTQEDYLTVVHHWVPALNGKISDDVDAHALRWALRVGSRSGRSAWQFAKDWVGQHSLEHTR